MRYYWNLVDGAICLHKGDWSQYLLLSGKLDFRNNMITRSSCQKILPWCDAFSEANNVLWLYLNLCCYCDHGWPQRFSGCYLWLFCVTLVWCGGLGGLPPTEGCFEAHSGLDTCRHARDQETPNLPRHKFSMSMSLVNRQTLLTWKSSLALVTLFSCRDAKRQPASQNLNPQCSCLT